jgi:hypothetical protein
METKNITTNNVKGMAKDGDVPSQLEITRLQESTSAIGYFLLLQKHSLHFGSATFYLVGFFYYARACTNFLFFLAYIELQLP